MYYPFFLYSRKVEHRPVFPGLKGDPYIADLSPNSPLKVRSSSSIMAHST